MTHESAVDLHLGWEPVRHADGCPAPVWDVAIRRDETYRGRDHSCPDVDCDHEGGRFTRELVRMVCRGCGTVHVRIGEPITWESTTTARYGYGEKPRKVGGLWLYPGQLFDSWGAARGGEPWDYLVTAAKVDRVAVDDVVGAISQGRGARGGVVWHAFAGPAWEDLRMATPTPRWAVNSGDAPLKTATAAARWIEKHTTDGDGAGTVR